MITNKIHALKIAKAKALELEQQIAAELNQTLHTLPAQYGFDSVEAFAVAVKAAGGGILKKRSIALKVTKNVAENKRRKRAVITDATREAVKKLVKAGQTGSAIAKALKISLPSVHNIKKALGLVKAKK